MNNRTVNYVLAGFLMAACFMQTTTMKAAGKQYEVIYKAAMHGTFDKASLDHRCTLKNEKEAVCTIEAGEAFPQAPEVKVENGYRIKSDFYKKPANKVEERTVVVAKYSVLVNEVEYVIRYVDENGNDLTAPIIRTTEKGQLETAYAKSIEGYQTDADSKQMTINENKAEIVFHYTSLAEPITRVEETTRDVEVSDEETNPVTPATAQPQGGEQTAPVQNNTNTTPQETVKEENNETPKTDGKDTGNKDKTEVVENNTTPKAAESKDTNVLPYVAGGVGILAVLFAGLWLLKKKKETAEN